MFMLILIVLMFSTNTINNSLTLRTCFLPEFGHFYVNLHVLFLTFTNNLNYLMYIKNLLSVYTVIGPFYFAVPILFISMVETHSLYVAICGTYKIHGTFVFGEMWLRGWAFQIHIIQYSSRTWANNSQVLSLRCNLGWKIPPFTMYLSSVGHAHVIFFIFGSSNQILYCNNLYRMSKTNYFIFFSDC